MGNLIAKLFGGSTARPSLGGEQNLGYLVIDRHVRRLIEIEQALGEIGQLFTAESNGQQSVSDCDDPLQRTIEFMNRLRVPGFIAYHLAQEGLAVINIIAASAAQAKKNGLALGDNENVLLHIDDVELRFRETLDQMEPYRFLDSSTTIEVIAARMAKKKAFEFPH